MSEVRRDRSLPVRHRVSNQVELDDHALIELETRTLRDSLPEAAIRRFSAHRAELSAAERESALDERRSRVGNDLADKIPELWLRYGVRVRTLWLAWEVGPPLDRLTLLPGEKVRCVVTSRQLRSEDKAEQTTLMDASSDEQRRSLQKTVTKRRTSGQRAGASVSFKGFGASGSVRRTAEDIRSALEEQVAAVRSERRLEVVTSRSTKHEDEETRGIEREFENPNVDVPISYVIHGGLDVYLYVVELHSLSLQYRSASAAEELGLRVPVPRWQPSPDPSAHEGFEARLDGFTDAVAEDEDAKDLLRTTLENSLRIATTAGHWSPLKQATAPTPSLGEALLDEVTELIGGAKTDASASHSSSAKAEPPLKLAHLVIDAGTLEVPSIAGMYVDSIVHENESALGPSADALHRAHVRSREERSRALAGYADCLQEVAAQLKKSDGVTDEALTAVLRSLSVADTP